MSQIILDDQLFDLEVLIPLARWITVQRLRDVRPGEVIKDERVPELLRQLPQPTFVTIDMGFWDKGLRDVHYCILCFPLRNDEQHQLPALLRRLLQLPEFRTRPNAWAKSHEPAPATSSVGGWAMSRATGCLGAYPKRPVDSAAHLPTGPVLVTVINASTGQADIYLRLDSGAEDWTLLSGELPAGGEL